MARIAAKPRSTVTAVITRADGTVEDLGVIASTHKMLVLKARVRRFMRSLTKNRR